MNSGDRRTCKVCGAQVPASRKVCPVCVLRAAMADEVSRDESTSEPGSVESISEAVGRRFDNYELMGTCGRLFKRFARRRMVTDWSPIRSRFVLTFNAETTSLISEASG